MIDPTSPILLVDDSSTMRMTTQKTLASGGFTNITTAGNGRAAYELIKKAKEEGQMFHIILLDWNMPEMDGIELLRLCRGELGLHETPIVMLTAVTDQRSVTTALECGATAYITKPVDPALLLEKVAHFARTDNPDKV